MSESDEDPRFRFITILNRISWTIILVSFAIPILFWSSLPDRIPHFSDYFGVALRRGVKGSIFQLSAAGIILLGFISLWIESSIPNFPVIVEDYAERRYFIARRYLALLKLWIASIIAYIEWVMIQMGRGNESMGKWVGAVVLGTLAILVVSYIIEIVRAR